MEDNLLEEEQMALLGRMLRSINTQLTPREMQVFDLLVESLNQRATRLRRLQRVTGRGYLQPSQDNRDEETEQDARLRGKERLVKRKSAEEVVRAFVECYNTKDFETEYFCLSRDFSRGGRKPADIRDYVHQRQDRMRDRAEVGFSSKEVRDVSSALLQGDKSEVECIEVHHGETEDIILFRKYNLIHEDGAWKIIDFATQKRSVASRSADTKAL